MGIEKKTKAEAISALAHSIVNEPMDVSKK